MKQLEPRKTVIGTFEGRYEGIFNTFTLYYGNVVDPMVNGKILHLPEKVYNEMLGKFLETHKDEYAVPTKGDVKLATTDLINAEVEIVKVKKEQEAKHKEALEKEREKRNEEIRQKDFELRQQEIEIQKEANTLKQQENDSIAKKLKLQKIGLIVLAVLNLLLIVLNVLSILGIVNINLS